MGTVSSSPQAAKDKVVAAARLEQAEASLQEAIKASQATRQILAKLGAKFQVSSAKFHVLLASHTRHITSNK